MISSPWGSLTLVPVDEGSIIETDEGRTVGTVTQDVSIYVGTTVYLTFENYEYLKREVPPRPN